MILEINAVNSPNIIANMQIYNKNVTSNALKIYNKIVEIINLDICSIKELSAICLILFNPFKNPLKTLFKEEIIINIVLIKKTFLSSDCFNT